MGGPWKVYRGIREASKHRGGKRREEKGRKEGSKQNTKRPERHER